MDNNKLSPVNNGRRKIMISKRYFVLAMGVGFVGLATAAITLQNFNLSAALQHGATPSYTKQGQPTKFYYWSQNNLSCVALAGKQLCGDQTKNPFDLLRQLEYTMAVYDSAVYKQRKNLKPLYVAPSSGATTVAVVKWMPASDVSKYYQPTSPSKSFAITKPGGIFVTPESEMKQACQVAYKKATFYGHLAFNEKTFDESMAETLGMPPVTSASDNVFLVMNVSLKISRSPLPIPDVKAPDNGIFRPCSNPDITKADCELPGDLSKTQPASYVAWFSNQANSTREIGQLSPGKTATPYPWTGLGYTYDWSHVLNQHAFGTSELVIPTNGIATVNVDKAGKTQAETPQQFCG
jgi:hypothetical protein